MKQIALNSPAVPTINIEDVFGNLANKIIVQTHENNATVLTKVATPENKNEETESFGFVKISRGLPASFDGEIYSDINTRTGGKTSGEALGNIKNRIRGIIDEGNCQFYVFDSLAEFAQAIIKYGWQ